MTGEALLEKNLRKGHFSVEKKKTEEIILLACWQKFK